MSTARRVLLWFVALCVIAGCGVVPVPVLGGDLIVMEVSNQSPQLAVLAVAAPGDVHALVGTADPPTVPPGATMMVRFLVPHTGDWAIWANGGELMGSIDLKQRRGDVPMGIAIGAAGEMSWWCRQDCT